MHIINSQNTCSQAELCGVYADDISQFKTEVRSCIVTAKGSSRKSIVANLTTQQHTQYGKLMEELGFKCVGKYYGNSACDVHVYIWGLKDEPVPALAPVKTPKLGLRRKIKSALAR